MTTDLVRIFTVTQAATSKPGLTQFIIWATLVAKPTQSIQVQTLNAYAASLCERAKALNRPIALTWYPTRFGPTLKEAHFLKVEGASLGV